MRRRVRVAVIGTGDELVDVARAPGPAAIRNSNGPLLRALLEAHNAEVLPLGIVGDDVAALRASVDQAVAAADIVLTTGGVSKGTRDEMPGVFEMCGVARCFHGWGVQPGGPLWCGTAGDVLVLGLPGNPAAVRVGFELMVRPALRRLAGGTLRLPPGFRARFEGTWGRPMRRERFRPARLRTDAEGRLIATVAAWQGSGDPGAYADADAWVRLEAQREAPGAEDTVAVLPLGTDT